MTFHEIFLVFVGLLVAPIPVTAGACVCYVGEEPNSIKDGPSLKLLPDQNPCECTEFRPGGVNTKQQAKPYEVRFGIDGHPEGWTEMDCIHELHTGYSTSPCATHFLQSKQGLIILQQEESFQSYPVRLEFTLQSSTDDLVEINSFSMGNYFLCTFELDEISHQMRIEKDDNTIQSQDFEDSFDGSTQYWVTINQFKLEFGRLGEPSALVYSSSMNDDITRLSIRTVYGTTVAFYGTCPDVLLFSSS